jgi:hypothetical protein
MADWCSDAAMSADGAAPSRRTLLKALGIAGGAVVATTLGTTPALAKKKHGSAHGIVVYRLSARGSSCRACKKHHRSFVFATHALAAANRAHPGCNCPITTQLLAKKKVRRLLPAGVGVVDLRKVEVKRRA